MATFSRLLYKRLERGRFQSPSIQTQALFVTLQPFRWLMEFFRVFQGIETVRKPDAWIREKAPAAVYWRFFMFSSLKYAIKQIL
jgi:hypothetical protein